MCAKFVWLACAVAAVGGLLALLPTATQAGKKPKYDPEAEEKKAQENYMKDLIMAYRLKELGLDKNTPARAASLLAAAALFQDLSTVKPGKALEAKPKIEVGEGDKNAKLVDEVLDAPDLAKEAANLLKQAKQLNEADNLHLEALIKQIETPEKKSRHVIGGPKQVARAIGPGQWQTYTLNVVPNAPVNFAFHGSFPMKVTIVRSDIANPWYDDIVANLSTTFHPGGSPTGHVPITIRVINVSNQGGTYQMFVN
jgi:hypothetical protein